MTALPSHLTRYLLLLSAITIAAGTTSTWADTATVEAQASEDQAKGGDESSEAEDKDENAADKSSDDADDASQAKTAEDKETGEKKEPEKKAKKAGKVRLAQVVLASSLPESPGGAGLFGDLQLDLRSTIERLERAADDDNIEGMILKINNPTVGRGQINELREAIKRLRDKDKKVYAELEMAMPTDYLIASACDEVIMPESGMILLPGVTLEGMFFKDLLAKVGVEADFIHMGEAKGAAEPYTRTSFSDSVRENLAAMTDDLYEHMISTVAFDRPITRQQATAAIDEGLMTAKRAKELGLVDRLAYPSEVRESLSEAYNTDNLVYVENYGKKKVDTDFSGPTGVLKLFKMMSGSSTSSSSGKKIALVYAVGAITTGESETDLFGNSSTMGSTTIVEALREADADEDVAAIVLRIDSPGGSAIASDLIWSKIRSIEKPVVASMGDVAASGGYYIAMGTDKIFAEPTTITGSIGVVGGKLALNGLYDKIGINIDTISRGANSTLFSSTNKFTSSERKVVMSMMEDTYEQFTSKAAEGRDMPVDQLKKLAGGKVYSGRQAKANGLVDEIGTLHDAIAEAKKLAGIDADKKIKLKTLPEAPDVFEALFGDNEAEKEVGLKIDLGQFSPELEAIGSRAAMLRRVFREPVVLMLPFDLEVK